MQFEIHLTVETKDIEKFKLDCQKFGCKPIVIETQRNLEFGTQVMTSDKYTGNSYERILNRTVSNFQGAGYKIIREKVEIFPQAQKHPNHLYYESHIRLTLPNDLPPHKLRQLKNHCISDNWHYSKNLFKSSPDVNYQMITLRMYDATYELFSKAVEKMEFILDVVLQLTFDKVEIEECVHDTNASIDKSWLNPLTATFFGGGRMVMAKFQLRLMNTVQIGGNPNHKMLTMKILFNVAAAMAIFLLFAGAGSIIFVEAFWLNEMLSLSQFIIGEILSVSAMLLAFCIHRILKEINY
jgi:hypothetical protein